MPRILFLIFFILSLTASSQELYVYSEPASNMPSKSISAKLTGHYVFSGNSYDRASQRYMPEIMFGFNKNLMVHASITMANMHTRDFEFESWALYAKYRFLSNDDIHSHFRMALFVDGSGTRSPFHYDEISLMGDKSGVEMGLIATQLWNKFALSATGSHTQVLDISRKTDVIYFPARNYQSLNFSLSGGLLLLPKEYTDYKQTNVNIYAELLAQRTLDHPRYYIDLAPALQFIFNSNAKLNIGHRFQLGSDMNRMATSSWQISFERTFLNALK